jgi:hypothetical protein
MSHRTRSTVQALEAGEALPPLSVREDARRGPAVGSALPEGGDRRTAEQRRTERRRGEVDRASILLRGKRSLVPVVNVSEGGATIQTRLAAQEGEAVAVALGDTAPVAAIVRWRRGGCIGIDFVP